MGWFLGIAGNIPTELKNSALLIQKGRLVNHSSLKHLLIAGGISETVRYSFFDEKKSAGWLLCGSTFICDEKDYKFPSDEFLDNLFADETPDLNKLSGHFAAVKFSDNEIECFTDPLGIRDLYFSSNKDYIIFSTRLDLISRLRKNSEIDFGELSTRWLMQNQFSFGSIIKDIVRLTTASGLLVRLNEDSLSVFTNQGNSFTPEYKENIKNDEILDVLQHISSFPGKCGSNSLIGLSGGLDSRFLLSLLIAGNVTPNTVTFGEGSNPDVIVSKRIASELGLLHQVLFDDKFIFWNEIARLINFISQTLLTAPASEYLYKKNIEKIYYPGSVFLDGGFAEILRRGLFNRLKLIGRKSIFQRNSDKLFNLLKYEHADIFNKDINNLMKTAAKEHIDILLGSLPEPDLTGLDNWLDLLSIRTKLVNYCGIEQARSDQYIFSVNPFSQAEVFKMVFNLPLAERKGAKMMKNFIRHKTNILTKFPLVKANKTVPFYLPQSLSRIYGYIFKIQESDERNRVLHGFLNSAREYIFDSINSEEVRNSSYYDFNKIQTLIISYYKGEKSLGKQVDWWLAFELFRKSV